MRLPLLAAAVAAAVAPAAAQTSAKAADRLTLALGDDASGRAELSFAAAMTRADAFVLRTVRAGAPGSLLTLSIDSAPAPLLSHTLAPGDCSFATGEAVCEVAVAGGSAGYDALVAAFKAGRTAHLTVVTAGVTAMRTDTSLRGFTRAFGGL